MFRKPNVIKLNVIHKNNNMFILTMYGKPISCTRLINIYGPKYENGEWKTRTNRELEEMSKGENIVKWIKGQRISWLGHLERMEENRMPKKIFSQELERKRRRGRPCKGWKEETEKDLQVLGVRRWRELATDRKKWQDIV
jgi:Cft2 family RNA processing exonuclease